MEDGPGQEQQEDGGGGDEGGGEPSIERVARDGGTAGFDQVGHRIEAVDKAEQAGGSDRIDDGRCIHRKLAKNADEATDVGI